MTRHDIDLPGPDPAAERGAGTPHAMLRERELAERWRTSQRTLQRWRAEGRGPAFLRIGDAIRYPMADILAYEARRRGGEGRR